MTEFSAKQAMYESRHHGLWSTSSPATCSCT